LRAIIHSDRGDHDEAIKDYTEAIFRTRNPHWKATYFNNRGYSYSRENDLSRALEDHNEALRLDPRNVHGHNGRGRVSLEQRDYASALQHFGEAIRLRPKFADLYSNRGLCYRKKRDFDQAVREYTEAIRLDPKNPEYFTARGWARRHYSHDHKPLKDHELAVVDFNEALRLDPEYAWALSGRVSAYNSLGIHENALRDRIEENRLRERNVQLLLQDRSEAIHRDDQRAASYFHRGMVYEWNSFIQKAQDDYRAAIKLDTQFKSYLHKFVTCHLIVQNLSTQTLKVRLQYEYQLEDGKWVWWPQSGTSNYTFAPGERSNLLDDSWPIQARRVRIWAEGTTSNWNRYKDHDLWLLPVSPYQARDRMYYTHTFK
jgi:tetratricopeptide (TPR) repeat protein